MDDLATPPSQQKASASESTRAVADVAAKTLEPSVFGFTALVFSSVLLFAVFGVAAALLVLPIAASVTIVITSVSFVATRHVAIVRRRRVPMDRAWQASVRGAVPDAMRLPSTYFLYVLGSGGHTGELCEMIQQQFRPHPRSHRRYIITFGDHHSEHAVAKLEGRICQAFPPEQATAADDGGNKGLSLPTPAGTWDVFRVVRARRVHQPLWTAWYSSLLSAVSICQALVRRPLCRTFSGDGTSPGDFAFPRVIVTNGPGTGFVVCLVAHLMKMFFLVPADRLWVVYIETWAHVSTLSLTGKLFYYSRLADLFVVQHEALAAKTGERFIGEVTKYGNLLGIRKTLKPQGSKAT